MERGVQSKSGINNNTLKGNSTSNRDKKEKDLTMYSQILLIFSL